MTLRAVLWCAVSTRPQADDDKYSLPSQIEDAQAFCAAHDMLVVDTLVVPGHSRNYKTLDKLASDAREKGIDAFDRLQAHLDACDFDVLVCRDANRFARKASLLHYIVESIVEDCGARIYSFNDGWIDATNADMFATLKGFQTAKEMKWIKEAAARGKQKLIEQGLPTGSHVPMSHIRQRDPVSGRDLGLVVDESKRVLWNHVLELLLEGIGWNGLGGELYLRYGHVDSTGRPYSGGTFYYLIYNPIFWGHSAGRHTLKSGSLGRWVFDESCEPPAGVMVYRNVLPPVFSGEQSEQLKSELIRRMDIRGRASPSTTYRFSGLFFCGECGALLSARVKPGIGRIGLRCPTIDRMMRHATIRSGLQCSQRYMTPHRYLQAYLNQFLTGLLEGHPVPQFQPQAQQQEAHRELDAIAADIATLERQIDTLISEQSLAPSTLQARYRDRAAAMADRLDILKRREVELRGRAKRESKQALLSASALQEIRERNLAEFWELPDREVNQWLRRLLGGYRFKVLDRKVVDLVERSTEFRR